MSRKDQLDETIDATTDRMDTAAEQLREKYGMGHAKATAIDVTVIVGLSGFCVFMSWVGNVFAWIAIAAAIYIILLSIMAIKARYFGGKA